VLTAPSEFRQIFQQTYVDPIMSAFDEAEQFEQSGSGATSRS
jgi:hypothetical protein